MRAAEAGTVAGSAGGALRGTRRARRGGARRILPGFGLTLGITLTYLALIVLIPLACVFLRSSTVGWSGFETTMTNPRVLAAIRLSFVSAALAAVANLLLGLLVAWVLTRYRFPGRGVVDAMVDLPFALPTAVAGITLTAVYAPNGWIGARLAPLGIKVAFAPAGIVVALIFIGLPFVVRTVQPVLADLEIEVEEAAASLGAGRFAAFRRVIFPAIFPAAITGFTLALARGLGEYGSVIFISGNLPMKTEIAPLLIVARLEEYDYGGASAIAVSLLVASFLLLFAVNALEAWSRREPAS